jgi:hypothetical protein
MENSFEQMESLSESVPHDALAWNVTWLYAVLRFTLGITKPGVHFTAVAREMMRRYPDYGLPILLWLTRGPGFGTAGAKEVGVPAELLGG